MTLHKLEEARPFLRKLVGRARRALEPEDITTFRLRRAYAEALYSDGASPVRDVREAVTTLEELDKAARRIYGEDNPFREHIRRSLEEARKKLADVDRGAAVEAAAEKWC
mgnify:CR=1 FL=1|jgi:hypothetical protein